MINNLPIVSKETPMAAITPLIPLNFVYPGLSLAQVFSIICAYRKLSLLILLAVLSLTSLLLTFWPRTYIATVTLMVNYEVDDPLKGKELPVGQVSNYIATQMELMQTQEVLLAVISRLKLTENKDYTRGYRGDSGTLQEWAAKKLRKNLVIYQGQQGSQLIYVRYSANNTTEAALVANTVADVYLSSSLIRSLKLQLVGQKTRLNKLKISFAPRHPDVMELQAHIKVTQNLLANQLNTPPANTTPTVNNIASQKEELPAEYKFISGGYYANVSFVNRATPPVEAKKPKILTGFLLGSMTAGVLALGIPLGYELFNRRVRCRDDLERHHGIPVLVEFGSIRAKEYFL